MMRRIAVVGDTLTGGGVVLPYDQPTIFTFHGHQAALIGGRAYCKTCKSTGLIALAGGPRRLYYMTTRQVALDGDVVLCQCPTHPKIFAELALESWYDDQGDGIVNTIDSAQVYNEFFIFTDKDTGEILANYPYSIKREDGSYEDGITDDAGHTHVVMASSSEKIEAVVGKSN